ncbi:DUF1559 domain-containing protein [bacterium]|nr:DUF1559 domain-containing protein [bacterium]
MSNPLSSEQAPHSMPARKPSRKLRVKVGYAVLVWFLTLIIASGFGLTTPEMMLLELPFGWMSFLYRILPSVRWETGSILLAAILGMSTIALLSILSIAEPNGLTWIAVRWQRSSAETRLITLTHSVAVLLVLVLGFAAGTAFTGLIRNVIWLANHQERLTQSSARRAAARSQTKLQLKQMGISMHRFHEVHGALPAGGTFDETGAGLHSWTTALLPYLGSPDAADLTAKIQFDQPWDALQNAPVMRNTIAQLLGPNMPKSTWVDQRGFAATHYAANSWLMGPNSSVAIRDIKDGTTNTLLIGQIRDQIPAWGNPVNWRDPAQRLNSPGAFGSMHVGVVQFVLADGSVRAISENIDPQVMRALASPDGGEPVGAF